MIVVSMLFSIALYYLDNLWIFVISSIYLILSMVLVNTYFGDIRPNGKVFSISKGVKFKVVLGEQVLIAVVLGYYAFKLLSDQDESYLGYYLILVSIFSLSTVRISRYRCDK